MSAGTRDISAAIPSATAATMTDAFLADTIPAQIGQAVYDEVSAAIPSDTAAAMAAAISAQLYGAVHDEILRPCHEMLTWLLRPTLREPVYNGVHDAM